MASRSSETVSFEQRDNENQQLREENASLRRVLAAHGIPVPQFAPDDARPVQTITPTAVGNKEERARKRIALFRSLFRGREDVYARRWENPAGRSHNLTRVICHFGQSRFSIKRLSAWNKPHLESRKVNHRL